LARSLRNGRCCAAQRQAARIRQLTKVDIVYGIAALLALVAGYLRVRYGVKGGAFYFGN
jgi:uncharacterized membrane protein